ncbi:hypothetical protein [Pukyongiella litopenaei]|uniref:Uncharacterized protein n=1 Tax=Pukyongiella litopenaei TaxID=2605946 RepID=A0A2S0ML51_9RHOB|nr:hypothetical protein [Pukyongiella litopenaei]AVO36610.1 hypothetical protein C6Y53_02120 [Pukyongiella litopenaei]
MDDYEDRPTICLVTGTYCVRAFCDDYGCANQAGVPVDENDIACGSEDIDETMPMLPPIKRKRRGTKGRQMSLSLSERE